MEVSQAYTAIIFDLDDTLVFTHEIKWAHHQAVGKEYYQRTITKATLAKHWGLPFDLLLRELYGPDEDLEKLRAAYAATNHRFRKIARPDALAAVSTLLAAGFRIGVLSAMNQQSVRDDLTALGFPVSKFEFIQGADDTSTHKPDPQVFEPALHTLRVHGSVASEVLYIGDALIDFKAAHAAGLGFLGVATGFVSITEFAKAGAKAVPNLASAVELLIGSKDQKS